MRPGGNEQAGNPLADDALTCLATSHRRPALRLADRIIVLKDGRVEAWASSTHCSAAARKCSACGMATLPRAPAWFDQGTSAQPPDLLSP